MLTRFVRTALLALLLVPAAQVAAAAAATSGAPIEINAIASLTGYAAFLGAGTTQAITAAEMALNAEGGVNGRPIKFVVHDDQSQAQQDVQILNDLAARHVPVIVGPGLVSACGAMLPLLSNGPVDLCFSTGAHPPAGSYQFVMGVPSQDQIAASLRYLRQRGLRKFALIIPNDATGQDAGRVIDSVFALPENKELSIVDRQYFSPADTSVSAQIARIRGSGAQALIAWATGAPFGTILHGIQEVGLDVPVLGGAGNVTYATLAAYASLLPPNTFFPTYPALVAPESIQDRGVRRAVTALRTAYAPLGMQPDLAAIPWDAAHIIVAAYRKYGDGLTAAQMRDFVTSLRYTGAFGAFDYQAHPQGGLGTNTALVVRYDKDQKTFVAVSKMGGEPR
jgi:branched-chain amino acid transport system substrate-binding protein